MITGEKGTRETKKIKIKINRRNEGEKKIKEGRKEEGRQITKKMNEEKNEIREIEGKSEGEEDWNKRRKRKKKNKEQKKTTKKKRKKWKANELKQRKE